MGSYAPLDNEVRDGVMEDEIGINSNFSETSLFAKTEEDSVLEQFSFTDSDNQFVQDQSIVEQGLGLVTDCTLASDVKEDVFDISGAFRDFVDSYTFQEDMIVKTDIEEKISVSDYREIYSTETGKAIHSFCLESGEDLGLGNSGSQPDEGSLADYVKTPVLSSSLSTQPSESVEQDNYNIIENAIGPLEKTAKDLLEVHEENQDLSHGVKTDLMTPKQQIAECHDVDPLEETVEDHLGVHEVKQELSSGVEIDLMSRAEQIEKSPCVLVRELSNSVSAFTIQLSTSSQLSGAVGDAPCRQLLLDDQERDGLSGGSSASSETEGNEKLELISRSTCSDIIISVPRRSTRQNKWCQNSQGGKTSAQRGKARNKKLQGELFLNTVRRKRSSCKRARSSLWGSLQNIIQVKENVATRKDCNHSIQEENQSSHERRDVPENGRLQKTHAESLLAAKGKQYASNEKTSHIRLKVKLGGQNGKKSLNIVQPEVLDRPAVLPVNVSQYVAKPSKAISSEMSETDDDSEHKVDDGLNDNRQVLYADGELGNPVSLPDPHYLDLVPVEKDLESTLTQDTSVGNNFGDCPRGYSQNTTEEMEAIGKQFLDPGTSPDSEVINLIQDVSIGADPVLTIAQAVEPTESAASNMELMSLSKQNKSRKVKGTPDSLVGSFAATEKLLGQGKQNKAKKSAKHRREEKIGSCGHSPGTSSLEAIIDDPKNSSQRHTLELTKLGIQGGLLKVKINKGSSEFSGKHVGIESSQLLSPNEFSMGLKASSKAGVESREQKSGAPLPARNRRKNACGQKKEGINKSLNKRKVKEKDSLSQGVHSGQCYQEASGDISVTSETVDQSKLRGAAELIKDNIMGLEIPGDTGISAARNFTSEDLSKLTLLSSSLDGQLLPTQNAWVCCDDCCKWRCISTTLADSIEATNCRWACKDNMDKAFADCSIPQEKSNAEINAELEISEASGEEDASYAYPVSKGFEVNPLTVPQQAPWRPIQSNLFLHRNRKANTIDEIMVCQCKPPKEGGLGCGDGCLNRVLNIECVQGTCPCGDHCSNQRFQKRNYAKLEYFRCGKKGYGLQLLDNVSRGDFLIEYVGEVLDLNAYEARQREYASRGQKHFYFMTLNGSEVIDACAKGNLGRFINHSCDPNCSTEKWIVNGEVCIGLFAIRNIEKGEEVTFDYNYVRVFGAAAKKCVCGSVKCRGYIGGDPLNSDEIVQGDSDEEFPEPVMVKGECEIEEVKGRITSNTILSDVAQSQHPGQIVLSTSPIKHFGNSTEVEESKRQSGHGVEPRELPVPMEDTTNKSQFAFQPPEMSIQTKVCNKSSSSLRPLEVSSPKDVTGQLLEDSPTVLDPLTKSLPYHIAASKNLISNTIKDRPTMLKERSPAKSSRSSSSIKKVRCRSKSVNGSKLQVLENKPKKMSEGAANNCPRGAEDKLNELLDIDGGISKRKDATFYLKLLIVTASSGDNGEALQSTRNLSIILDALLKTKKRNVLNDVISKNGLQMLHNILKQNRTNHKRIPIIRKLLKILEYLAEKEVLTLELINSAPPCSGMESFRESIMKLAWHKDIQVHEIARRFRDTWMPHPLRRNNYSDRDATNVEKQPDLPCHRFSTHKRWCGNSSRHIADNASMNHTSIGANSLYANMQEDGVGPSVNNYPANRSQMRKRKSRWDQPEEGNSGAQTVELMEDHKAKRTLAPHLQQSDMREAVEEPVDDVKDEIVFHGCDKNISEQCESASKIDAMEQIHDDAPPGFPSLPLVSHDAFPTATENLSSDVYHRNCSCELVTGCPQERFLSHITVSYGIPLFFVDQLGTPQAEGIDSWKISTGIPFHPFPPLPSYPRDKSKSLPPSCTLTRMEHGESQRDPHGDVSSTPCTSGAMSSEVANTMAYNQQMAQRMRSSPGNLGRRYFRQQKWTNSKRPPWVRNRNGWGFMENNLRSGTHSVGVGNSEKGSGNVCYSEGVNGESEHLNSVVYQNSINHYDHGLKNKL